MTKRTLESANAEFEKLEAEEQNATKAHRDKLEAIRAERNRLSAIRHPFNVASEKITAVKESIERAKRKRETYVAQEIEFKNFMDLLIAEEGSSPLNAPYTHTGYNVHYMHCAAEIIVHIDRWLKDRAKELENLIADRIAYAKANDLEHLLQ